MNVLRCADCGKEKRGKFDVPEGGQPIGGPPMDH